METTNNPDYHSKRTGSPEQLLSYFESHQDKYPDGPKKESEMPKSSAPIGDDFYDEEEEAQDTDYDSNADGSDEDYEEGYRLFASNKDDF